ncbi:MAG: hypothetical protein ACRD4S_16465 [Candidatus Acidiferrales bacterium]
MNRGALYYGLAGILFCAAGLTAPVSAQQQPGPMPAAAASQQQSAPQSTPAGNPPAPPAIPQLTKRPHAPATGASAERNAGPKVTVPTGTHIPLVLHNAISTRSARPGDPVYFETLFPVMVGGKVAIPAGSYVSGEVTDAKRPGRVKGRAELMIKLNTLILPNAYMIDLNAVPSNAGTGGAETVNNEGKVIGDSDKASDAGTVVKDTAAGAGIGAIAGRGAQGAGIGAGIGVVAGLATVLLSRGPEAELPRGTTVEVVLDRPILLDADKDQFTGPGQASTLPGPPNREPQRSKYPF